MQIANKRTDTELAKRIIGGMARDRQKKGRRKKAGVELVKRLNEGRHSQRTQEKRPHRTKQTEGGTRGVRESLRHLFALQLIERLRSPSHSLTRARTQKGQGDSPAERGNDEKD